jgi:SAM-dependent methyltransferase
MRPSHIQSLKRTLSTYAPPVFRAVRESRRFIHRQRNKRIQDELTPWKSHFIQEFGFTVQGGPFKGMTFHSSAPYDAYLPLLVGCYEAETHAFIESALARKPSVIIDVGCEAGYVAVGLALRARSTPVYGFDIEPQARAKCRALAEINGVGNQVVVEDACTPDRLQSLCDARPLVFSDCEGYEFDLLDPQKVPGLKQADIIVELHDFLRIDVDITPSVLQRFSGTHDISLAGVMPRSPSDFPCLTGLPEHIRANAMHEDRIPYQQWAFLKSKAR